MLHSLNKPLDQLGDPATGTWNSIEQQSAQGAKSTNELLHTIKVESESEFLTFVWKKFNQLDRCRSIHLSWHRMNTSHPNALQYVTLKRPGTMHDASDDSPQCNSQ